MVRQTFYVTLTYKRPDAHGQEEEVVEHYHSIFACAKHWGTSPNAISQYIRGEPFKNTPIPKGAHITATFTQPQGFRSNGKILWHCDACNRDYQQGNKSNHLISKKHIEACKTTPSPPLPPPPPPSPVP